MSTPQPAIDTKEMTRRVEETHKAITRQLADLGKLYADLDVDAQTWTTISASGAAAYVFVYLQVTCTLIFPGLPPLNFLGRGGAAGLGATGALGGQAKFNVDPRTLIGAPGITFEAASLSIVGGGFQVTWYQNHRYIGHAEFYGLGISIGTPGGGTGMFS